jgi:hypothetical protein
MPTLVLLLDVTSILDEIANGKVVKNDTLGALQRCTAGY